MDNETGQQDVTTVFEAFMPFLESFFQKYFVINERLERERPEYSARLKDMIDTLLVLLDTISKNAHFGTKKRLTDVKDVFLILMDKVLWLMCQWGVLMTSWLTRAGTDERRAS
jgi:hypothetical protein